MTEIDSPGPSSFSIGYPWVAGPASSVRRAELVPIARSDGSTGSKDTVRNVRATAKSIAGLDLEAARVQDVVAWQAKRRPSEAAVIYQGQELSYAELERRATDWAGALVKLGAGRDVPVGVCLARSSRLPAALLAVLKSGAAYLPLDAAYPEQRLSMMIADARSPLVLVDEQTRGRLPQNMARLIDIDQLEDVAKGAAKTAKPDDAESLAYVIYTSGSTGRPKGVAMPHRPLVNLLAWQVGQWGIVPGSNRTQHGRSRPRREAERPSPRPSPWEGEGARDATRPLRTLQFAPLSFDVSFQEIFSTWWSGGTLVMPDEEVRKDPRALVEFMQANRVQRAFLPVIVLHLVAEVISRGSAAPSCLQEVITAGERLTITPEVRRMFQRLPNCRLVNQYGPSETHVVTQYVLTGPSDRWPEAPPIGRAIAHTQIHLLDEAGGPVSPGETGEVYIGGRAVARGYLHQAELTDQRFVPDDLTSDGGRIYRTGDLATELPDGNLAFLGRCDQQVKVRGYRIELEEVESQILAHPEVARATVCAADDGSGYKRLVAGAVLRTPGVIDRKKLVAYLKVRLPDYMIPSEIALLTHMPTTPSGKVDTTAVAAIARAQQSATDVRPASGLEKRLSELCGEVLGCEAVGVDQNLLDVGFDSLSIVQLSERMTSQLGRPISVAELIRTPTVGAIAELFRSDARTVNQSLLIPLNARGTLPPLFLVHPGGGNALCYLQLSKALGSDRPVYAFQSRGIDTVDQPPTDIVEMAGEYVRALREQQPHGPYAIGGWSFGGVVAYEMARQLEMAGEPIKLLAVIDAGFLYAFEIMRTLFPSDELGLFELLRRPSAEQLSSFAARTAIAQLVPPAASEQLAQRIYRNFVANAKAILDYRPAHYSGRLDLLLGAQPLAPVRHDPREEWSALCNRVVLHEVPGNHLTLIHPPHVQSLANTLNQALGSTA
ncbi:MAG: non-ribosomal peptide synthetase [Pirellulales bacterium]